MTAATIAMHCVIVAGLGGEAEFEQRFTTHAAALESTLRGSDVSVRVLQGKGATREALRAALRDLSATVRPDDAFMMILVGHGTFDGVEYKFNLPGPDVSASELAALMDRVPAKTQLIVNTTSASGGGAQEFERPGRTVVTATKSGTEKNATVFARYFIDALRDGAADTDKNEVITAAEAFRFAELQTKQFYETQKRLATEHPLMGGDGRFALLRTGALQALSQQPEKRALLEKREELERRIDDLKLRKAALPAAEYTRELRGLLLELARTQQELDK